MDAVAVVRVRWALQREDGGPIYELRRSTRWRAGTTGSRSSRSPTTSCPSYKPLCALKRGPTHALGVWHPHSMRPYEERVVTFRVLLRGYCEAFERLQLATAQSDPGPSILALFEALNWAVVLDDRCIKHWVPDGAPCGHAWLAHWRGDAGIARAIRFARNRVHHQWAEALELRSPSRSPRSRTCEWYWRSAADLPPAPARRRDPDGETAYQKLLAGRPTELTLSPIRGLYSELADLLEPRLARDRAAA